MMNKKECLNKAIEITTNRNTGGHETRDYRCVAKEIEEIYNMLIKLNNECGKEKSMSKEYPNFSDSEPKTQRL